MKDLDKWANTNDEDLYEIARKWAKKYNLSRLRAFQLDYEKNYSKHIGFTKLWQCATWAIDIREFGE